MKNRHDFTIPVLGPASHPSPLKLSKVEGDFLSDYVRDTQKILYNIQTDSGAPELCRPDNLIELAGPRENIFFIPEKTHAAIVTCGGICPGLNDVIRSLVMTLWYHYGVRKISGIRYGYRGLLPEFSLPLVELHPDLVTDIHRKGGTILGSSRGHGDKIIPLVDSLEKHGINILFVIGGDGTQKGSAALADEAVKRGLKISVIGIPKTIDNDLSFVDKTFGFDTAVAIASLAISSAHVEAQDNVNGISIVKVMGRNSGFIAAQAALARNDVNFVLIPEAPFDMQGENGLLSLLKKRMEKRHHAVILAAEGAGQDLMKKNSMTDASGNRQFEDIGLFLKTEIERYFKQQNIEANIKYINPGYMIRSAPAISSDSIYCARLGNHAVHAAMAGKTQMLISLVNNNFVHIPIHLAVSVQKKIDTEGPLWRDVLEATGQPLQMKN